MLCGESCLAHSLALLIAKSVRNCTGGLSSVNTHFRVRLRREVTRSKICVFQSAPTCACAVVSSEAACKHQHPKCQTNNGCGCDCGFDQALELSSSLTKSFPLVALLNRVRVNMHSSADHLNDFPAASSTSHVRAQLQLQPKTMHRALFAPSITITRRRRTSVECRMEQTA